MAHIKVLRQSINFEQWSRVIISEVKACVIENEQLTEGWIYQPAELRKDGTYNFEGDPRPIVPGETWGRPDGNAIFTGNGTVPAEFAGKRVGLRWVIAANVIVRVNGELLYGLDPNREIVPLLEDARGGEKFEFELEAYVRSQPDDRRAAMRHLRGCIQEFSLPKLVVIDEEAQAANLELSIVHEAAFSAALSQGVKDFLVRHLEETLRILPPFESGRDEVRAALPAVRQYLRDNVFIGDASPFGRVGKLAMVAHSHLDVAFFWQVHHTVQKNARTCLVQLWLMDHYPEFLYSHSQSWAYEMLKSRYPELYERIKQRVVEGRWEVAGGLYVEPDCNLISAESLTRQCLYAQNFFLKEFGFTVNNCWLPDVFGNSSIMPQILKGAGIDYFVSHKMSTWNDTNPFPYNNFMWSGIDGTEIAACVPPVHFAMWHHPESLVTSWDKFIDKDVCDETLHLYGYGDGGSGVTVEMLERARRLEDLPGMPRFRQTSGSDYLKRAFANSDGLGKWEGEIYLEAHRGTYTTKGRLKLENRFAEFHALEIEALAALAHAIAAIPYPNERIETAWKHILLNQFHDILPGSNIAPVERDALETYTQARTEFDAIAEEARSAIIESGDDQFSVFNPFSFKRTGLVSLSGDSDIAAIQKQQIPSAPGETIMRPVTLVPDVPALGFTEIRDENGLSAYSGNTLQASDKKLENEWFILEFDQTGCVTRLYDRRFDREIVPEGRVANEWQLFEDRPGVYNAWDILRSFEDHRHPLGDAESIEVVENGPLSAALKITRRFRSSLAVQVVRLYTFTPRIDFETWIDWREREKLLKVAFPLTVKALHYTTDTSAGGFERPNNRNTTWEQARFEVPSHKWVDLSESGFGVALLNNCKYGLDVKGDTVRLSLLRGPIRPDPSSDEGEHRFTYSLLPHAGDWKTGGVIEEAFDLNWPMRAIPGSAKETGANLKISSDALHIQSLKGAEDGSGDLILRLIELRGSRGTARVELIPGRNWRSIVETDLLERPTRDAIRDGKVVIIRYRPNGIITLRFSM